MKSGEIRHTFLRFFARAGHTLVPSSSLIPAHDPTLLFANAGMNQFKDVFLGKEKRSYTRAASIQKCIRAGGKHNDLENVGFTKRHLTFFEMLGNFSFGDYFKKEAIEFAWQFLTKELALPAFQLYATVYKNDDESYTLWHRHIGLPAERIFRLGEADNFWQMGDTGPCGPCSEILIDRGSTYGCGSPSCVPGCSCDRYLEIWNLVFMQFDRQADGTYQPLQQTGVDTGMGLERLCSIIQNKESVFDTDLFAPLLTHIEVVTNIQYATASQQQRAAFRVLADHIRSVTFALADGCSPSNEGRGYVVRKIIRRAALFAQKLGNPTLFSELASILITSMGDIYPELVQQQDFIRTSIQQEVEKFSANLTHGQAILERYLQDNIQTCRITGEQAFKLYDTYGFPLELTKVIAHEHGYQVDIEQFEQQMEQQRAQSSKKDSTQELPELPENIKTVFTGYEEFTTQGRIIALILNNQCVDQVHTGAHCWIITDRSPFYVECGGQVNDRGTISYQQASAEVQNLKKLPGAIALYTQAPTLLKIGDSILQTVDSNFRERTMKNHTATHLLQSALIKVLGPGIKQAGSLVTADYLRFDFTYHATITQEQLHCIERLVNDVIMKNIAVNTTITTYQDALKKGVIAFFGEKYNPDCVRIVEVSGFSAELCGGTHVRATGDIGPFKITEVSALSTGIKRIVALTGPAAVELFQSNFTILKNISQEFKVQPQLLEEAITKLKEQLKAAHAENKDLKKQIIKVQLPLLRAQQETIGTIPFLFTAVQQYSNEELRDLMHELSREPGFYFVLNNTDNRSTFLAHVTPHLQNQVNLKKFAEWLKTRGLQGGGSGATLQGGGPALSGSFKNTIKEWLLNFA